MKTASFSVACFKAGGWRPAMLQFLNPMRTGDFTVQESLMTSTLIKTCTSQGEENAVICNTWIYCVVDSIDLKKFDYITW